MIPRIPRPRPGGSTTSPRPKADHTTAERRRDRLVWTVLAVLAVAVPTTVTGFMYSWGLT